MLAVYTVMSSFTHRRYQPETFLGTALAVVVMLNPLDTSSAGFWLSFVAVWVILRALTPARKALWSSDFQIVKTLGARPRIFKYVKKLCLIQAALFACLISIQVYFFGQISTVSPMVNLVCVPVFAVLVVPMLLTGSFCILVGGEMIGRTLLVASSWIVSGLIDLLRPIAEFRYSVLDVAIPSVLLLALPISLLLLAFFRRFRVWAVGFGIAALVLGLITAQDLKEGQVRVRVWTSSKGWRH